MKYEMDRLLKDVYQQEVKPESILNQKTLRRMQTEEQNDMKKFWTCKKIAVAAVLSCLVVTQGVGAAYAAMWNRRREAIRNSLHMPIFP